MNLPPKKPGRRAESWVVKSIALHVNALPMCRVFRNNVGALPDKVGRLVRYGLAIGSSDLIGSAFGIPIAIECKAPGWVYKGTEHEKEQQAWIRVVESLGWVGGFAQSIDDAVAILARARHEATKGGDYRKGVFDERMAAAHWLPEPFGQQVMRGEHCK